MKKKCAANPKIEFTGYVDEDDLPDLFQSSSVAVMPYSSSTGCSGVAHLACAYGVPIVCADLEDFRQMSDGEGMAIEFYKPGEAKDLADCLIRFLSDSTKQQNMAEQNFSAALRMTMPNIVLKYLRHFELEQRTVALRNITRFRKLPNWVPSKSLLLRLMTRKSLGWVHRSALHRPAASAPNGAPNNEHSADHHSSNIHSLDDNVDGRRKLAGTRIPMNGNGVMDRSGSSDSAFAANAPGASARSAQHSQSDDGAVERSLVPRASRSPSPENQIPQARSSVASCRKGESGSSAATESWLSLPWRKL